MREIRLYIEGGGIGDGRTQLRRAFHGFMRGLIDKARAARIRWNMIACGRRRAAYDDFCEALRSHHDCFNLLVVDSEAPFACGSRWQHLKERDGWSRPVEADERNVYLMVQSMETWLLADLDNLQRFYGRAFDKRHLPDWPLLEAVPKADIIEKLCGATRRCQRGEYHKGRHSFGLMETTDSRRVRARCPECDSLFSTLQSVIEAIQSSR